MSFISDAPLAASCRRLTCRLLLTALGVGVSGLVWAQHSHHPAATPAASVAEAAKPTATRTPARKFAGDDTLRQAMGQIGAAYRVAAADIAAGKFSRSAYRELARLTEERIDFIIKNCTLEPQADQALHYILHDLREAIAMMRIDKLEIQRSGALAAEQSLRQYALRFEHPGWSGP